MGKESPYIFSKFNDTFYASLSVLIDGIWLYMSLCSIRHWAFYMYSMWPLVRDFSENDKIFRGEKTYGEKKRSRDLLISTISYDEVSAFLLWVKARN